MKFNGIINIFSDGSSEDGIYSDEMMSVEDIMAQFGSEEELEAWERSMGIVPDSELEQGASSEASSNQRKNSPETEEPEG